jgi:hypothetical protein
MPSSDSTVEPTGRREPPHDHGNDHFQSRRLARPASRGRSCGLVPEFLRAADDPPGRRPLTPSGPQIGVRPPSSGGRDPIRAVHRGQPAAGRWSAVVPKPPLPISMAHIAASRLSWGEVYPAGPSPRKESSNRRHTRSAQHRCGRATRAFGSTAGRMADEAPLQRRRGRWQEYRQNSPARQAEQPPGRRGSRPAGGAAARQAEQPPGRQNSRPAGRTAARQAEQPPGRQNSRPAGRTAARQAGQPPVRGGAGRSRQRGSPRRGSSWGCGRTGGAGATGAAHGQRRSSTNAAAQELTEQRTGSAGAACRPGRRDVIGDSGAAGKLSPRSPPGHRALGPPARTHQPMWTGGWAAPTFVDSGSSGETFRAAQRPRQTARPLCCVVLDVSSPATRG